MDSAQVSMGVPSSTTSRVVTVMELEFTEIAGISVVSVLPFIFVVISTLLNRQRAVEVHDGDTRNSYRTDY
jgi:hypothetical protein